ncbi:MAG: BACON domain-containing protein, partial [Bacteroidales bacterium]|nr:BACON domain-containing protein [Bacteroidales bacterium]
TTNEDGVQDPNNNDGYLYAANQASSGSNILKTQATMDNSASWAVSIGDVTVGEKTWENATIMFADIPSSGRGLLRFNSNDKLFSAYGAGTSMEAIKIYRLDKAASLSFNATLPNGNEVPASEQEVPVYVWGNVAWTASVTGGASLNATSGTGNTVLTLSVPANTDTENTKSYSVTVTTSAAVATQSYTLNITQAKKIDAGGDPVKVYSFSLDVKPNPGSNGTYAGACDVTIGGITWNVTGVSNSSDYFGWRLGGKSLTNVDRAIYSKTALPAEVTKVIVSHCRANITINSYTLTVHSSATDAANGSNPIASLTATVNVGTQDAPATTTFEKTDNTSWAGCYYRFAYNVTNGGSSNKYVEFRGLEMWGYPSE